MKFHLSHKEGIIQQIQELQKRAKIADIEASYVAALKHVIRLLQTRPLEWGDPEYHQIHEGSIMCHGIYEMLFVRFAVYEVEEKVHIIEVRPVPSAWPSNP